MMCWIRFILSNWMKHDFTSNVGLEFGNTLYPYEPISKVWNLMHFMRKIVRISACSYVSNSIYCRLFDLIDVSGNLCEMGLFCLGHFVSPVLVQQIRASHDDYAKPYSKTHRINTNGSMLDFLQNALTQKQIVLCSLMEFSSVYAKYPIISNIVLHAVKWAFAFFFAR